MADTKSKSEATLTMKVTRKDGTVEVYRDIPVQVTKEKKSNG